MGIKDLDDVLLAAIAGVISESGGGHYDSVKRFDDIIQQDGVLESMNKGVSANVYVADGSRKFHVAVIEEEA